MRRLLSSLVLAGCFFCSSSFPLIPYQYRELAQAQTSDELFYTFFGQKIPLNLRRDTVAVSFKPTNTRSRSIQPLYLQLQQDLRRGASNSRSIGSTNNSFDINVKPLGENIALVNLPSGARSSLNSVQQQIQKQPYVKETLPILTRKSTDTSSEKESEQVIVLPNEIVIGFDRDISLSQRQIVLLRHDLEVVRALRFSKNRYLVRSKSVSGTEILNVANQLAQVAGVQSATPNFIQATSYQQSQLLANLANLPEIPNATQRLEQQLAQLPQPKDTPVSTRLLPLQWHLNSTPKRGQLLDRTDVRATEAWKQSNGGRGVVVAVVDSLIQWDHPDLIQNIYKSGNHPDKLTSEEYGWDFSSSGEGDADTRLSSQELALIQTEWQNTFKLPTSQLIKKYQQLADSFLKRNPKASKSEIAHYIRNQIRLTISSEFHGTWSAGVIAANSPDKSGVLGVAPNTQILPVRVFGLGGVINSASLTEAIGYSASRNVDVINMSLGSLLPDEGLTEQIFDVLDTNRNLVIIASAGNDNLDGVGFPAGIPGVVSVGATNMTGNRTFYSSYGAGLDVVAPGGETQNTLSGGILTTGGTWLDGFWQGMSVPDSSWGMALDPAGKYVQVQGTSFSGPIVSGVVALMKGEDPKQRLSRDEIVSILKKTATYDGLNLSKTDINRYRLQKEVGFGTVGDEPISRPSGIFAKTKPVSAEEYFFGRGLVNADAAVKSVKQR
ncbi:peptidase S8 and S53, subtilisin, kexin, sedolisin [Rivularia sp. IAM M-261]|nr:peptidase S8 and S53, subtilisin, kexin, sedolisin [Rivularia sp. IAM M-261]